MHFSSCLLVHLSSSSSGTKLYTLKEVEVQELIEAKSKAEGGQVVLVVVVSRSMIKHNLGLLLIPTLCFSCSSFLYTCKGTFLSKVVLLEDS